MENQTPKNTKPKQEPGQPTYGDKPWQTPEENDQKKSQDDDSCGCGSDSHKGNKKETATTKRA